MRPTRLLMAALILPALILLSGCSNKADRIVGNKRLIRGPGGLGTTVSAANPLNRDTYVPASTANSGPALLLGLSGSYEARSRFSVSLWRLPNEALPGFTPVAVHFVLPQREILGVSGSVSADLWTTAVPWDANVTWPGPALGTALGSTIGYNFLGQFRVNLGPGGYSLMQQWAAAPLSAPSFELVPTASGTVGSFQAGAAVFRVFYHRNGTAPGDSAIETDSTDTRVSLNAYIHSPLSPAQTGTETAMVLGGAHEAGLALRAPVPPIVDGSSVNELRFLLQVTGTSPALNGAAMPDTALLTVEIFRIRGPWVEGVTDQSSLTVDAIPVSRLALPQFLVAQDTALSIPLPRELTREWGADSTSNDGVLIKIRDVIVRPAPLVFRLAQTPAESPSFLIGSRESSRPPILRVSTTSPPPGRF